MGYSNRIKGGELLYASHTLDGTYFENALILLVANNRDGVFGVILNRPSRMPLKEMFNIDFDLPITERLIYTGGPVDEDMLLTIRIHDNSDTIGGIALSESVEYGGHWDSIKSILMSSEQEVRIFLGYAGWQEAQLDREISEGSWSLYRGINTQELLMDWYSSPYEKRRDIVKYLEEKCKM